MASPRSLKIRDFRKLLARGCEAGPLEAGNRASPCHRSVGIPVAYGSSMLKLLGSYALAKLLGFGLFGAIVIYALLSLLT
jgi:hypothetical protein